MSRQGVWLGRWGVAGLLGLLAGCASYSGSSLRPGESREAEVRGVMGEPALVWQEGTGTDTTRHLAFPRGPMGYHTWIVDLDGQGRLSRIRNVMQEETFATLRPGHDDRSAVQRRFGPPLVVSHFERRDEEVWEYRYCDNWGEPAWFYVLFDATSGIVRRGETQTERQKYGGPHRGYCSR